MRAPLGFLLATTSALLLASTPAHAEAKISVTRAAPVATEKPSDALKNAAPPSDANKVKDAGTVKDTVMKEDQQQNYNSITLRGLNKVTARSQLIEGPLGTVMRFGNLEIVAQRCWQSPPEEQPENAALLEIWELKPKESPARIFAGWMFSSSPGLSSLQNAVYDVTVVSCNRPEEKAPAPVTKDKDAKPEEKTPAAPARKPEDEPDPAENPLD